jgi:hypothetical protein
MSLMAVSRLSESKAEGYRGFWRQRWESGLGVAIDNNSYDDTITDISSGFLRNMV